MKIYIFRRPFRHRKQTMDVLDSTKSLLPEFQIRCNIELIKTCVKVSLKSVGIVQVYGMRLI